MNSREEWNSILSGCAICCWIFAQEMLQFAHSHSGLFCFFLDDTSGTQWVPRGVSSNVAGKSMKILHILRVWMRKSFCHLAIFDDTGGYIDDIWWPDEPMSECSIDIWEIADFEMMFSDFPLLSVNLPEESTRIHTHTYIYITVSISWPWLAMVGQ